VKYQFTPSEELLISSMTDAVTTAGLGLGLQALATALLGTTLRVGRLINSEKSGTVSSLVPHRTGLLRDMARHNRPSQPVESQ
jgi:hypothetical protein